MNDFPTGTVTFLYYLVKPWVKRYPTSPFSENYWKDVITEAH